MKVFTVCLVIVRYQLRTSKLDRPMWQEVPFRSLLLFYRRNRFTVSRCSIHHYSRLNVMVSLHFLIATSRLHRSEIVADSRRVFQSWRLWHARYAERCIQSIEFVSGTQFATVRVRGSSNSWYCVEVKFCCANDESFCIECTCSVSGGATNCWFYSNCCCYRNGSFALLLRCVQCVH